MRLSASAVVQFGGETHEGWLPGTAAVPEQNATIEVKLDVVVEADDTGYLLTWAPRPGQGVPDRPPYAGDLWFEALEAARTAALERFGVQF